MAIREQLVIKALDNWAMLNIHLNRMTEAELQTALNNELEYGKRKQFIIRIHARYTKLRAKREREAMLRGLGYETSND